MGASNKVENASGGAIELQICDCSLGSNWNEMIDQIVVAAGDLRPRDEVERTTGFRRWQLNDTGPHS
jgi:hypothetical protein